MTQEFLRTLPRSKSAGLLLLVIVTVWSWLLATYIDLGEFSNWRLRLQIFIPIAAFLTWQYVDEFLAARALGMIVLLAAEPLLEAAGCDRSWRGLFLASWSMSGFASPSFGSGCPTRCAIRLPGSPKTKAAGNQRPSRELAME